MPPEIIDLTTEVVDLPEDIKQGWILQDGLPVPHLFQFKRYPPREMLYYTHSELSQLLHGEDISFDPEILLQHGPPPQKLSDQYQVAIRAASSPIRSFTMIPLSGDPIRLPTWVLDYWREIRRAMGYRCDWKRVLVWLRGISQSESMVEICDQVMAGLLCFPWNGNGYCTVHDMASVLTDSWLGDFHIDHVLMKISNHYHDCFGAEIASHHVFLPVIDVTSIVKAYGKCSVRSGQTADKRKKFLEVENGIIQGHIESVAGVLYLPNHWTSLIVTFKPPKIFYGDSLGASMPGAEASSFRRWMCHMFRRSGQEIPELDISIYQLATSIQQDFNSCGLFALNAIKHHYFQDSPLLQPDVLSVAHCHLQIALGLLQEGTVSVF
jgi:hypothetical protein